MDTVGASSSILCVGMGWFPKTPGGLDRYVYELAHHLAKAQEQVELFGLGVPEVQAGSLVKLTNLADLGSPIYKRLWTARNNFLNRKIIKPDAINLHFALYSLPLLKNLPAGVPVTFTFHGPWALESQLEGPTKLRVKLEVLIQRWIEDRVYRSCDRFIVLSKAFGTLLHHEYGIPWDKIHIIPGGVDTSRFQPSLSREEARARLNWPIGRRILFTPRRLVNRMGLDKLLNSLIQVKVQVPDVWLAIAGKGPLREALEGQVRELGLENDVSFLGFLPDEHLPVAYQAADLTVVPSQSLEGFGLILLESLACGTPAVCTPVGGMPEVLLPFYPPLITESTDEAAITARLVQLLNGEIELPSREACHTYASTNFAWETIAQKVQQVLLA
jgi:glycosyltransferase involved in cell wall biosynthesis